VWEKNELSSSAGLPTVFSGIGLEKGAGGSISIGDGVKVSGGELDGGTAIAVVDTFSTYRDILTDNGLHPSNTTLLDHSNVKIIAPGTGGFNVMANGIYDFILAYYNPKSDGSGVVGYDLSSRLPNWPSSLTLNGLNVAAGVTTTTRPLIGTQATNSDPRKAVADGMPNEGYLNNITVPMANYMRSALGITQFNNTNIIGDSGEWVTGNGVTITGNNITLIPLTNVGLIGNYSSIIHFVGTFKGVLDIKGTAPKYISQNDSTTRGYINLWNVSSNIGVNRFYVVSIKDLSGIGYVNKVEAWAGLNQGPATVVIYPKKYNPTAITGEIGFLIPEYRAFFDGNTPKITPVTGSPSVAAAYKGKNTNGSVQVPPLDEASWINAENNNGAAPTFQNYSNAPKWDNAAFNAVPVASAAPAPTGVWLANMPRSVIEAVLTDRRRLDRFGRA